jgi:hypothetical protein
MRKRVEAWELSLVAPTAAVSDAPMKSAAAAAAADRYGPGPLDLDAMSISDEPTTAAWSFNADAFGD